MIVFTYALTFIYELRQGRQLLLIWWAELTCGGVRRLWQRGGMTLVLFGLLFLYRARNDQNELIEH